jgi:hypothetical protein
VKWFKHESKARNDERIARLEDLAGLEGYGFYFKMLEIVAESMDASNTTEMTYSISRWGRQLNISTKKFIFLAQCCVDVGLMFTQRCDDNMVVNIPNLLKYRDNHTKNLQVTSKQELEVDKDKEVDKEVEKTKPKGADKSAVEPLPIPDFVDAELWNDFMQMRKSLKAQNTVPAIKALITELKKIKDLGHDPEEAIRTSIRASWKDVYAPKGNKASSTATIADQNKASTEAARKKLFGTMPTEKDVTHG